MNTQSEIYRDIRHQSPSVPAHIAWQQAGHSLEVKQWAEAADERAKDRN